MLKLNTSAPFALNLQASISTFLDRNITLDLNTNTTVDVDHTTSSLANFIESFGVFSTPANQDDNASPSSASTTKSSFTTEGKSGSSNPFPAEDNSNQAGGMPGDANDLFGDQDWGDAPTEAPMPTGQSDSSESSNGNMSGDANDLFGDQYRGDAPDEAPMPSDQTGNSTNGNTGIMSGGADDLFADQYRGDAPDEAPMPSDQTGSGADQSPDTGDSDNAPDTDTGQPSTGDMPGDANDLFGDQDWGDASDTPPTPSDPNDNTDDQDTGAGSDGTGNTTPALSDPKFVGIKSTGQILDDGVLSEDELDQNFDFEITITGIDPNAQSDVTIDVEGRVYTAEFQGNDIWVASIPATELEDGEMLGLITADVTDTNGAVSQSKATFDTSVNTDFNDIPATEDQATGVVEMDLENMTSYITGLGQLGVESDYNIEFIFSPMAGGTTLEMKAGLIQIGEYVSSLITDDVVDVGDIDDLRITVVDYELDGEGGKIAGAVVTNEREQSDGGLSSTANLLFDIADLQPRIELGTFKDTLLHEVMHTLGFGTIDNWDNLIDFSKTYGGSYRFEGENANLAYAAQHADIYAADEFSDIGIAVEANFGRGNAKVHWDRETFADTEGGLMATGSKDSYFGKADGMLLATLEDLGYETIWDASNPGGQPEFGYDDLPKVIQIGTGSNSENDAESFEYASADNAAFQEDISANQGSTNDMGQQNDVGLTGGMNYSIDMSLFA